MPSDSCWTNGAKVNGTDEKSRTPLMFALASDLLPLDVVKLFIERGADVNARKPCWRDALGIAKLRAIRQSWICC